MRCMPPYYHHKLNKKNHYNRRGLHRASANVRRPRAVRAFNDNQGYQQGYIQSNQWPQNKNQTNVSNSQSNTGNSNSNSNNSSSNSSSNSNSCPSAVQYIGNVFLLGLTTLVGELVDLQAANALNVLLQPFQFENDGGVQQEILAGDVQDNDIIDLLDGLL